MDILSRNLDGAGPLRTVSSALLVRKGQGITDRTAATRLGRQTGARWVVFGTLLAAGPDSVRLTAQIVDAQDGGSVGEIDVRENDARMDRVTDSATVGLIRELGRKLPIGAVRQSAFAAVALPVLRSFLRGEQFFRRTAWDSAMAYYQHAVSLDSGFAIGWRRMNGVRGCGRKGFRGDPLAHEFGLRAGSLNRGLAPRDSLLITADSLSEALFGQLADTVWREHRARLFKHPQCGGAALPRRSGSLVRARGGTLPLAHPGPDDAGWRSGSFRSGHRARLRFRAGLCASNRAGVPTGTAGGGSALSRCLSGTQSDRSEQRGDGPGRQAHGPSPELLRYCAPARIRIELRALCHTLGDTSPPGLDRDGRKGGAFTAPQQAERRTGVRPAGGPEMGACPSTGRSRTPTRGVRSGRKLFAR